MGVEVWVCVFMWACVHVCMWEKESIFLPLSQYYPFFIFLQFVFLGYKPWVFLWLYRVRTDFSLQNSQTLKTIVTEIQRPIYLKTWFIFSIFPVGNHIQYTVWMLQPHNTVRWTHFFKLLFFQSVACPGYQAQQSFLIHNLSDVTRTLHS